MRLSFVLRVDLSSEFLIHAADVEGLCQGIDEELVTSELYSSTGVAGS